MSDIVTACLRDARRALFAALRELETSECSYRIWMALAALEDALEQRHDDLAKVKLQRHLETFADAAAAPGVNSE